MIRVLPAFMDRSLSLLSSRNTDIRAWMIPTMFVVVSGFTSGFTLDSGPRLVNTCFPASVKMKYCRGAYTDSHGGEASSSDAANLPTCDGALLRGDAREVGRWLRVLLNWSLRICLDVASPAEDVN